MGILLRLQVTEFNVYTKRSPLVNVPTGEIFYSTVCWFFFWNSDQNLAMT